MRLIDANAFLERVLPECKYPEILKEAVENQPTIDAEPVRHGRWNYRHEDDWCYCTACGTDAEGSDGECLETDYCPHCGAKMDE